MSNTNKKTHFYCITIIGLILLIISFLFFGTNFVSTTSNLNNILTKEQLNEDQVRIVRVVDGDTFIVETHKEKEETLRLLLIDTPESVHPNEPPQKFGKSATEFAKEHLPKGKVITLERGESERDKYNRLQGHIYMGNKNFGLMAVKEGYARIAYVYEPNTRYLDQFKKAEDKAKKNKLNIWSIDGYVTDDGFDMSVFDNIEDPQGEYD